MQILYRVAARLRNSYWMIFRPVTIGVGVVALQEPDRVFLVRQSYSRYWTIPGGAVERGETLGEAAARELLEETGLRCKVEDLMLQGVYFNKLSGSSNHAAVFFVKEFAQAREFKKGSEIVAGQFFNVSALPENISPLSLKVIRECYVKCQ
jgi:ADP-ribose pyrophosphatase YjhB (NUDIX family)